jgi:hypothetical protein
MLGAASNSKIEILQWFQCKTLRSILKAPWFINSHRFHEDLQINTVLTEIKKWNTKNLRTLENYTMIKNVILLIVGFRGGSMLILISLQGLCIMSMWALIHMAQRPRRINIKIEASECYKKVKSDSTKECRDPTKMLTKTASGYVRRITLWISSNALPSLDFHHHLECAVKYSGGKCVIVLAIVKVRYFYLFNFHQMCMA